MPKPKTKADAYKRLTVRIPIDLYMALEERAEEVGRPMNTEIVFALRASIGNEVKTKRAPKPPR